MQNELRNTKGLTIIESSVEDLVMVGGEGTPVVAGVSLGEMMGGVWAPFGKDDGIRAPFVRWATLEFLCGGRCHKVKGFTCVVNGLRGWKGVRKDGRV